MESIAILKNYEIIQEKIFNNVRGNENKSSSILSLIETIKDLDSLSITNHFTIKLDNKLIVYRKSSESLLSVIIKTDKHSFRTSNVIDISSFILNILEKKYFAAGLDKRNNLIDYNMKEILFTSIEGITINFIDYLRKNKLYVKFIYFNSCLHSFTI